MKMNQFLKMLRFASIALFLTGVSFMLKAQDVSKLTREEVFAEMKKVEGGAAQRKIARAYINEKLILLPDAELFTPENLKFIAGFVSFEDKKAFALFYPKADRAAKVLGEDDISNVVRDRIISEDFIKPLLVGTTTPDFKKLKKDISAKLGKSAIGNHIMDAKIEWYKYARNWNKVGALTIENFEKNTWVFGSPNPVNVVCFEVFFYHVTDQAQLEKALSWMEKYVISKEPNDPAFIDTYANLLYKTGKVKEAIEWEEKAVKLRSDNKEFAEV